MTNKINLNSFFVNIKKKKIDFNFDLINYLNFYNQRFLKKKNETYPVPVAFIVTLTYSRVNTLLTVSYSQGELIFFASAGQFFLGKKKKSRSLVLTKFFKILMTSDLEFLREIPIALHLKNIPLNKFWIIRQLKKKLFIKTIRIFNVYPHNGCRKRKGKRKKIRSYRKKIKLSLKKAGLKKTRKK